MYRNDQSAFFFKKKHFVIHHVPQPGRQTKKSIQHRKQKILRNDIMQTESSIDPGQISIQTFNEAREMITITKERRHISC